MRYRPTPLNIFSVFLLSFFIYDSVNNTTLDDYTYYGVLYAIVGISGDFTIQYFFKEYLKVLFIEIALFVYIYIVWT